MHSLPCQRLAVDIFRLEGARPGAEDLRFEPGPGELLKGQAVVLEKAGDGHGSRRHDAGPACRLRADNVFDKEVHAHGHRHGQHRANELPGGQAEEYGLLVRPHFLGDFDFHVVIPP